MTQYLVLLPSAEPRYATATDQEKEELNQAHGDFADLAQVCGRLMATPFHPAIEIRPTLGM